MISSKEIKFEQDNPVPNGTVCIALYDASPEYNIDLDFKKGEQIVIVEPCNVLFFYIGRNLLGNEGVIPINYFKFDTSKKTTPEIQLPAGNEGRSSPHLTSSPPRSPKVAPKPRNKTGSVDFSPQKPIPAPRGRGEPLPRGQSLPSHTSADDDRDSPRTNYPDIDKRPPMPLPQDVVAPPPSSSMATNNFKTDSGWFTPNLPHVLGGKSQFSTSALQKMQSAVYVFAHKSIMRIRYCGGSYDILNELVSMFEGLYTKNPSLLSPLEVELKRYPSAADWVIKITPTSPEELHLCRAMEIEKNNTLNPDGLNPELELFSKADWDKFIEWALRNGQN